VKNEEGNIEATFAHGLIYYAPVEKGGLFQYALCQIRALVQLGVTVHCLGYEELGEAIELAGIQITFIPLEKSDAQISGGRVLKAFKKIREHRANIKMLVGLARQNPKAPVVISAYSEYFAPFWAWPLRRLHDDGTRFGVITHDPIRDFVLGPRWWHQWSISLAYSFVDVVFVHSNVNIEMGVPVRSLSKVVIPHGMYGFPITNVDSTKENIREMFSIPPQAFVALSFGHIRDGKNIDLFLQTMPEFPNLHLIVAGQLQSSTQKPISYYKALANELGVQRRCHWNEEFVPDDEVGFYFEGADVLLLTYSADFQSASGVLNANAQFRLPVLASSGPSSLQSIIETYELGVWVVPDDLGAISVGVALILTFDGRQLWDAYLKDNSWDSNAKKLMRGMLDSGER